MKFLNAFLGDRGPGKPKKAVRDYQGCEINITSMNKNAEGKGVSAATNPGAEKFLKKQMSLDRYKGMFK